MSGIIVGFRERTFFENLHKTLYGKCHTKYLTGSCPAGETVDVLSIEGKGILVLVNVSLAGASADAKHSRIIVESDGDSVEHVSPFEVAETHWLEFGRGWTPKVFVHKWDDSAYVFSICLELNQFYKNGCRIKLRNGDSANNTSYRMLVMWRELE